MKSLIVAVFFILGLTLFIGEGFSRPIEDMNKPRSKEQKERIRKRITTLKMWKLTEVFDLDEKSASKLFPLLNKYDKKRVVVRVHIKNDMRKLRKSVATASKDEIREIITRLKDNHRKYQGINDEELREFGEIFTLRDVAKFIIFKHDFKREMKNRFYKFRGKQSQWLKHRGMAPPDEKPR
jgi:hypothetical protein